MLPRYNLGLVKKPGRFTCSGGKKIRRSMELLHILIYFRVHPFLPREGPILQSFRRVLTAEAEELYLSLNGNRTPTCYLLWEDFLLLSRTRERFCRRIHSPGSRRKIRGCLF
ncbi:hypothetical protein PUN28_015631 [Cardiocondyla obscurior]|uniref:Transposase n=1 Tax=Cardiocondyla obscurior TaxID=286306 RepID=A0AAW2EZA8_9HYME